MLTLLFAFLVSGSLLQAQTAEEIIAKYFEVTGGAATWEQLKAVKMTASVNQGGMEIPVDILQTKDGRDRVSITFQGHEIVQSAFDGTTLWSTNFQTMKPEKADGEMLALKKAEAGDFPDALFKYKERGYKAELIGKETIDGTECYKIKLTKKPVILDGKEIENIEYYYFDTDSGILIAQESEVLVGPQKGMVSQSVFSDYQEVEGLYFPFSITQGAKGQGGEPILISKIVVNPEIQESYFLYPTE